MMDWLEKTGPGVNAAAQETITKLKGKVYQTLYKNLEPYNLYLVIKSKIRAG